MLSGWATVLVARLGEQALAALREDVVDRALSVPLAQVERAGTGDLVARVGDDVDAVSRAVREAIPALVVAVVTIALTVVGLGFLDWRLALAGFVAVPIHVLAVRWYQRRAGPQYAAERIAGGERAQQLTETVSGARTVRAFRLGPIHTGLVRDASARALDATLRTAWTGSRFFFCVNGAELAGTSAVLVAGFLGVRAGMFSVGDAAAAALYFHGLFNPIGAVLTLIDTAQDAAASLRRLVGVTSLRPPAEPVQPAELGEPSVQLKNVHFAYTGDHDVLDGVDLDVAPGERVALVGPSGAGKTTIAKLIAGIHRPGAGSVRLGGFTHDELGPANGRAAITLVTQEVHVFAGPVADDLRLARPDATDAQLRAALATVGAEHWVDALPDGPGHVVGEGGHPLTTTQAPTARAGPGRPGRHADRGARRGDRGGRQRRGPGAGALRGRGHRGPHDAGRRAPAHAGRGGGPGRGGRRRAHRRGRAAREARRGTGPYAALWAAWSTSRQPERPGALGHDADTRVR